MKNLLHEEYNAFLFISSVALLFLGWTSSLSLALVKGDGGFFVRDFFRFGTVIIVGCPLERSCLVFCCCGFRSLLLLDNEPDDDESDESGGVSKTTLCFLLRQVFGYFTYKAILICRWRLKLFSGVSSQFSLTLNCRWINSLFSLRASLLFAFSNESDTFMNKMSSREKNM